MRQPHSARALVAVLALTLGSVGCSTAAATATTRGGVATCNYDALTMSAPTARVASTGDRGCSFVRAERIVAGPGATSRLAATSALAGSPRVATKAEAGLTEAFHYTGAQNVASIEQNGLRVGSYATPNGELSPLQAQIDLALPPNRGLPGATVRVDIAGLRDAGYEIPGATQVGPSFNMPGGGYELQFPYAIPPEFLKVVP